MLSQHAKPDNVNLPNRHFLALQKGQESALTHYMKTHGSALRFFAFQFLRDKALAEEVVSDAFVKLWQGRSKLKSESSIQAFLYISTKNACLDECKKTRPKLVHDPAILNEVISPTDNILHHMIHVELIQLLVAQVNRLPAQQADVFKLTYFEELETEEISQRLGISTNGVYFARSKALSRIRKTMRRTALKHLRLLAALPLFYSLFGSG